MKTSYSVYVKLVTGIIVRTQLATANLFDVLSAVERLRRYYGNSLVADDYNGKYSAFGPGCYEHEAVRAISAALTLSVEDGVMLKSRTTVLIDRKDKDVPVMNDFPLVKSSVGMIETGLGGEVARVGVCLIDVSMPFSFRAAFLCGPKGEGVFKEKRERYRLYTPTEWLSGYLTKTLPPYEVRGLESCASQIEEASHLPDDFDTRFFDFQETEEEFMKTLMKSEVVEF